MRHLRAAWSTLRSLVGRTRADAELDEELAFHVARETDELVRLGTPPREARRIALARFGGVQRWREECRAVRGTGMMDELRTDVRHTLRVARRHPAFTLTIVGITALGIAASVTTFGTVSGVLLAPLPFADADRVASLQLRTTESTSAGIPDHAALRLRAEDSPFAATTSHQPASVVLDEGASPEQVRVERVATGFMATFRVRPVIGRGFVDENGRLEQGVAMLGHQAWRTRFGGDSSVIGRALSVDGAPVTIIGVMPPRFRSYRFEDPVLWLPMTSEAGSADRAPGETGNVLVRLRDGVEPEAAEAWLRAALALRVEAIAGGDSVRATPVLVPIRDLIVGDVRRPLLIALGAVLLVALLVAVNLATMLLARGAARAGEMAVRRAIGASRGRQVRQLVTESVTLVAAGGVVGVLLSLWSVGAVRALAATLLPRSDAIALDWRVMLFAIVATLLVGVLAGIAPAFAATRVAESRLLGAGGGRLTGSGERGQGMLVVLQVALSVMLLVGAGLLVKGFLRVSPSRPGFALEQRVAVTVRLGQRNAAELPDVAARRRFVRDVMAAMRAVPGVRDVAASEFLPLTYMSGISNVTLAGRESEQPLTAHHRSATENFFRLMEIPLRAGRPFAPADHAGAERVAIVNETAAARWWPGRDAVGEYVRFTEGRDSTTHLARVVGVMRDIRMAGGDTRGRPELYVPVEQSSFTRMNFVAHVSRPVEQLAPELRRAVWSVAPTIAVEATTALADIADESVAGPRFLMTTLATFAGVALVLAAVGLHGLLAFGVARRRREIGIRLALGARAEGVGALVVRRGARLAAVGVVLGLVVARLGAPAMREVLLEVSATDAGVFAASAVALLVVAVVASALPAWRAARVDPMESLRLE